MSRFEIRVGKDAIEGGLDDHRWARAALWIHQNLYGRDKAVIWDLKRKMRACSKRAAECDPPCKWHGEQGKTGRGDSSG